ncbi:MAG: hypothetical protein ACE14L_11315 [Terriglobales bacterium]
MLLAAMPTFAGDPAAVKRAREAMAQSKYKDAIKIACPVWQADPNDADAASTCFLAIDIGGFDKDKSFRNARIALKDGKYEEAEKLFRRVSDPNVTPWAQAFISRIAGERKRAEEQRQAELRKQQEAQRQAELAKQQEAQRQAELAKQQEAARQAELARQQEAARQAELQKQQDAQRQADLRRQQQEAQRQAELKRQEEEGRHAEARRLEEERQKAEKQPVDAVLVDGIRDYYARRYSDAQMRLLTCASKATGRQQGLCHFFLGVTKLTQSLLQGDADLESEGKEALKSAKARLGNRRPDERYVSRKILKIYDSL